MAQRLMLLMILGLGAMYMLHLLAQDWNTIQRPPAKRSLTRLLINAAAQQHSIYLNNRTKREYHYNNNKNNKKNQFLSTTINTNHNNTTINWKRILSRDPFQCLESLICQLMADAKQKQFYTDAITLCDFLEANMETLPINLQHAYDFGVTWHGNTQRCFDKYPICWYSAKTMLNILQWFKTE